MNKIAMRRQRSSFTNWQLIFVTGIFADRYMFERGRE